MRPHRSPGWSSLRFRERIRLPKSRGAGPRLVRREWDLSQLTRLMTSPRSLFAVPTERWRLTTTTSLPPIRRHCSVSPFAIVSDSRFNCVVQQSSVASVDSQVEVQVTDLSLDCRTAGRRVARAAVTLDVVKTGRGPRVVAFEGTGTGEADASDGNYTRAFSEAVDTAVGGALKALKSVEHAPAAK